jgi:hypothetical protein
MVRLKTRGEVRVLWELGENLPSLKVKLGLQRGISYWWRNLIVCWTEVLKGLIWVNGYLHAWCRDWDGCRDLRECTREGIQRNAPTWRNYARRGEW